MGTHTKLALEFIGGPYDGVIAEGEEAVERLEVPVNINVLRYLVDEPLGHLLPTLQVAVYERVGGADGLRYRYVASRRAAPVEIPDLTSWAMDAIGVRSNSAAYWNRRKT